MLLTVNAAHQQADISETVATTGQRSNIYGFLALLYRQEPDAELLARFDSADFATGLESAGVKLGNDITSLSREALLLELAVEYTRLFIGPGKHISPHESVYCQNGEGGILGKATADVRHFIEATGFRFQSENRLIPDHIAVELEFMQGLTLHEAQAWSEGDSENAVNCLGIQARFLEQHLARWVSSFCKKVIAEATLSFYRELAALTEDFIYQEQEAIKQRLGQLK